MMTAVELKSTAGGLEILMIIDVYILINFVLTTPLPFFVGTRLLDYSVSTRYAGNRPPCLVHLLGMQTVKAIVSTAGRR